MNALRNWAACVLANLIIPAALFALFILMLGVIAALGVTLCALTGPGFVACMAELVMSLAVALLVVGGILAAFFVAVFIWAAITCLISPVPVAGAVPTPVGGALSSPLDCAGAQALLAQAQAALQQAEDARDTAADRARQARRRARNAVAAVAAAVAGVLASAWNPMLLGPAIAAVAAAIALSVRRARQLAQALAALAAAEADVAQAIANLGAAEALVALLCGGAPPASTPPPPPSTTLDPGNSVLFGTRAISTGSALRKGNCLFC
jgi:hypothetical protein